MMRRWPFTYIQTCVACCSSVHPHTHIHTYVFLMSLISLRDVVNSCSDPTDYSRLAIVTARQKTKHKRDYQFDNFPLYQKTDLHYNSAGIGIVKKKKNISFLRKVSMFFLSLYLSDIRWSSKIFNMLCFAFVGLKIKTKVLLVAV